jgi:hypothetical protein
MDSNTIIGFLGGIIATLIGFGFTMLWEIIKSRSEKKSINNLLILTLSEELEMNNVLSEFNIGILNKDIDASIKNETIVTPLCNLHFLSWQMIITNLGKL